MYTYMLCPTLNINTHLIQKRITILLTWHFLDTWIDQHSENRLQAL